MWFAILAAVVGVACIYACIRVKSAIPSSQAIQETVVRIRAARPVNSSGSSEALLDPAQLVTRVRSAASREHAVAELNEFVSEVSRELGKGSRTPGALSRACFASGALFAVLALARLLGGGASTVMVTPALLALTAGVTSGLVCLQIGRSASKRRQELRKAAQRLRSELEKELAALAPR